MTPDERTFLASRGWAFRRAEMPAWLKKDGMPMVHYRDALAIERYADAAREEGRREALEEAAGVADAAFSEHGSKHTNPQKWDSWHEGWADCAAMVEHRIRALAEKEKGDAE